LDAYKGEENYSPISSHNKPPSITCAVKRGGQFIAKDIANRFLPDFYKTWELAQNKLEGYHQQLRQKEAMAQALQQAWPSTQGHQNIKDRLYIGRSLNHSGFIDISYTTVNLELRYISLEQAIAIAQIIEPAAEVAEG